MQIGEKIKRLRVEKQLTQEELANRCELSKGFISQLENDLTSPSIATLIDILDILGTNLNEFFSEASNEKTKELWSLYELYSQKMICLKLKIQNLNINLCG